MSDSKNTDESPLTDEGADASSGSLAPEGMLDGEFIQSIVAFDEALSSGDPASSKSLTHPSQSMAWADLEDAKDCLRLLERIWPRAAPAPCSTAPSGMEAIDPALTDDAQAVSGGQTHQAAIHRLGRFEVLRELGRGGGGIVYQAVDLNLHRHVALKVPRPEFLFTEEMRRRFLREAQAAAGLDHPNIVPVYEAGEVGPICYIASAFCAGPTLATWLKQHRKPVAGPAAARLIAILADAVEHAHSRGILHRDLKPSNILLDSCHADHGQPHRTTEGAQGRWLDFLPKLTDFGLAKLVEFEGDETRSGAVLGTPAYMAPEQAEGRLNDIDATTDVYALGAILYELLTGRPPFQGTSDFQTLQQTVHDEPTRPSRFQKKLSRELEASCLKCLEKEGSHRYAKARDLADDLRRYLHGEPTIARPPTITKRAWNFAKRQPGMSGLMFFVLLLVMGFGVGLWWHGFSLQRVQDAVAHIEHEVQAGRRRLRQSQYAAHIQEAHQAWQNTDIDTALSLLDQCSPGPGDEDMRGFEWYYVRRLCDGGLKTLHGQETSIRGLAFAPNGKRLASCGDDGTIWIWDTKSGRAMDQFPAHDGPVNAIAYSPDGKQIVSVGDDHQVKLWDTSRHRPPVTLAGHTDRILCAAFSPDGGVLATGGADRTVRVWHVESGRERMVIQAHDEAVQAVVFAPDGRRLATGGADQRVKVWDLGAPDHPVTVSPPLQDVLTIGFSPDGRTLGSGGGLLHLWQYETEERPTMVVPAHRNYVKAIAFSPDGQTMASTGNDLMIRVWDLATEKTKFIYRSHTRPVHALAFSPDGALLASADKDGVIRLWDPTSPQDRTPLPIGGGGVGGALVGFSPAGDTLASLLTYPDSIEVQLWNISEGRVISSRRREGPSVDIYKLSISTHGQWLTIASLDGTITVWNILTDDVRTIHHKLGRLFSCDLSPDGKQLALSNDAIDGVHIYDIETGAEVAVLPGRRRAFFSPDSRLIALESTTPALGLELWDYQARERVAVLRDHAGFVICAEFSADGRFLVTGSGLGTAQVWDVRHGTERLKLRGHGAALYDVTFTPDGRRVATASEDGTIKLWDFDTGQMLFSLPVMEGVIASISFSPDGEILATACKRIDGNMRVDLWRAPRDKQLTE